MANTIGFDKEVFPVGGDDLPNQGRGGVAASE